jgi:transposase InsO family protein
MTTDHRLIACIGALRKAKGNIGSHQLKPFVDAVAKEAGLITISVKTIEKIIKRYHFTYEGKRKYQRKAKVKRLRSRYAPKVSSPGFIQVDSIIVHQDGYCFRFVSVIDIFTKLAYVAIVNRLTAAAALEVFYRFQHDCPYLIHTVQTDNGSEFLGVFDQELNNQDIAHLFIYPHSPKINGVVERFNRTIQEEFISRSDELFLNRDLFRVKLTQYLDWYNTKRPHAALRYQAPMQFINQIPKCS